MDYKWKRISTAALAGPLVSAIVLSSFSALGQQCPEVSLQQCDVPGYLETPCGQQQMQECSLLIADAFGAAYDDTPNEHVSTLPDSMGGNREITRFVPYSFSSHQVTGANGTYAGVVNKSQLVSAKNPTDLTPDDQDFLAMKQSWAADGITVNSCEEYVYKRYYDYSVFEDAWGSLVSDDGDRGSNYRAIYQAAVAPDGIVHRELMSVDGQAIPLQFGQSGIPKNAYYTFQVGPYPTGFRPYPFNPRIVSQIDPRGRRGFYQPTFEWHQQMSDILSQFLDQELENRAAEQKSFSRLMQSRQEVWGGYQQQRTQMLRDGDDPQRLDWVTAEELFSIDHDLETSLRNASEHGCLNISRPTACDWSPQLFKEQLDAALLTPREDEYQMCIFLTGNNFGPESFVRNADRLDIPGLSGDYTVSPSALQRFMATVLPNLSLKPHLDPATRALMRGWERSGGDNVGNDWFGVSYSYSAGAGVRDFWGAGSRVCDANAYMNGNLSIDGKIVKKDVQVLRVSADARTRPSDVHVVANVKVAGIDVYNFDKTYPLAFSVTQGFSKSSTFASASYSFVVGFVPVTVAGGISGSVGLNFTLSGALTRNCPLERVELNTAGTIKPWAQLDAYASAAVSAVLVSVGVKGTLVLINIGLPLNEDIRIYLKNPSDPDSLTLKMTSALDLSIKSLSGKVTLFVKIYYFIGSKTFEVKLIDWKGPEFNTNLYAYSFETPIGLLR